MATLSSAIKQDSNEDAMNEGAGTDDGYLRVVTSEADLTT